MPPSVLLSCEGVSKAFGSQPLFSGLSFTLHEGDHVGLVGPNGAGKSTFLKILAGVETPDAGSCTWRKGLRVGYVPQTPTFAPGATALAAVLEGLAQDGTTLESDRQRLARLALARAEFDDPQASADTLSGGWRARLAIARELACEPDVLLLDEPTNHLDIESILWLESLLRTVSKAFVVIGHDRYFLENVARRMLEIDRIHSTGLFHVTGNYSGFLEARDEALSNQAAYQETLANLVRREVAWLRRGAKARTSKSRSRIQSAQRSIEELEQIRERTAVSTAGIDFSASGRKTKRLWSAKGLRRGFENRPIVDDLELLLTPKMRLGVVGPNGSGKTTLLRLIVGELEPEAGEIRRADGLRSVYFDQSRQSLDLDLTLRQALSPEGDSVVYREREIHIITWARRFLFRADQLDTPVNRLSGGERARIVLARVMLQPADLLVLDEPTNDLDIPTLDILEESLLEFPGALVLVTHDRYLLDRVSTQVLALDGQGGTRLYADYGQWEADRRASAVPKPVKAQQTKKKERAGIKRLTYMEQREWNGMEATVLAAESQAEQAERAAEDPAIASDAVALERRLAELTACRAEVDRLYGRWAELEDKQKETAE